MSDKLPVSVAKATAKFHLDKAVLLDRDYYAKKMAGDKKIGKLQDELKVQLDRIKTQADDHRKKAAQIINQSQSASLPHNPL